MRTTRPMDLDLDRERGRPQARAEPIPREPALDSTLGLLLEGYDFISRRCRRLDTDVFRTRILLRPTICMLGADATRVFYDARHFVRGGAMFVEIVNDASVKRLVHEHDAEWDAAIDRWVRDDRDVVLMREAERILCVAACRWAGVPLAESEVEDRCRDLSQMLAAEGRIGARFRRATRARRRCEAWIADLVDLARPAPPTAEPTPLSIIANAHGPDQRWLPRRAAAAEVLDLLLPIVGIGRFVAFAALALHGHPEARDRVLAGDDDDVLAFVHEVRRYYPCFPFAAARVRHSFVWRGLRFPRGARVLLDQYGTDHDPRIWRDPERFRPDRFHRGRPGAFGHRCAAERIAIELMAAAVSILIRRIAYELPAQDLRIDRTRMPTAPASGVVIRDVRRVASRPDDVPVWPRPNLAAEGDAAAVISPGA